MKMKTFWQVVGFPLRFLLFVGAAAVLSMLCCADTTLARKWSGLFKWLLYGGDLGYEY